MKMPKVEKLLTSQNRPLKVYLDGFDVKAFLKTAVVIKKYGGIVSIPDYETVVLSVPDRTPGTQFITFDVDWLHDSIQRNKLQDPGKYLIPSEDSEEPEVDIETPPDTVEPTDDDMTGSNEGLLQENQDENKPMQEEMQKENKVSSKVYQPRKKRSLGRRKPLWSKKKKLSSEREEKKTTFDHRGKRVSKRWSHNENQQLVRYLIDNNVIDKYRSKSLWQHIEEAQIFEHPRTAMASQCHFVTKILNNIEKYIDDPEILKKFEDAKRGDYHKKNSDIQLE